MMMVMTTTMAVTRMEVSRAAEAYTACHRNATLKMKPETRNPKPQLDVGGASVRRDAACVQAKVLGVAGCACCL